MTGGGFAGKVLRVDLTSGRIEAEPLEAGLAEKYIGGLGLCLKLAYDTIEPGCDPLSPGNPIVFGVGPLVGTDLPSTSRFYAVSKLPASRMVGWCGAGGFTFGVMLKNAGFDHVVIEGRSPRPVVLSIDDGRVELRDAGDLWGRGVDDTCRAIRGETESDSETPTGVLCIGPAGENLITFSMAFIDRISTLGRGGFGAVMGSKNLKAVTARGTGGVRVADRRQYRDLRRGLLEAIGAWPHLQDAQDLGLLQAFPLISKAEYHRVKKRRVACVSCPIGCKDVIEVPDGPHAGLVKPTSSIINLLTPNLYGFQDYLESIKCINTVDDLGLDMFEFFGLMVMAEKLVDHGVIPAGAADPEIRPDRLDSMEAWARKISLREGLGAVLAGGFEGVIDEFGPAARDLAPALIKGMHPYAGPGSAVPWDRFGTMELGQLLEPRGPHVGSGGSPTYFAQRPLPAFYKHLRRMGVPEAAIARIVREGAGPDDPPELKVGALLRYSHAWFTILGSLGVCARGNINRFYDAETCARAYQAVTGIATDLPALHHRVARVWTLYRLINLREGLTRAKAEVPPPQWFGPDGFKEYLTGEPLTPAAVDEMIGDYFREWGWDPETGVPSEAELTRLGLEEI
jgi:aldehyde:ferredoxin oxidoreductase